MRIHVNVASLVIAIIITLVLLATLSRAADAPKPCCTPSEVQTLKLQVKQRDAQLAQRDLQAAQQHFQQAITELSDEADAIKKENGWPHATLFDPNNVTFSPAPTPPAPLKPATVPPVPEKKP